MGLESVISDASILSRLRQGAVRHGTQDYVALECSKEVVIECEGRKLAIIGIEGFIIRNDGVWPQEELVRDFGKFAERTSWQAFRSWCNQAALVFIESIEPQARLFFNFVISDGPMPSG